MQPLRRPPGVTCFPTARAHGSSLLRNGTSLVFQPSTATTKAKTAPKATAPNATRETPQAKPGVQK